MMAIINGVTVIGNEKQIAKLIKELGKPEITIKPSIWHTKRG